MGKCRRCVGRASGRGGWRARVKRCNDNASGVWQDWCRGQAISATFAQLLPTWFALGHAPLHAHAHAHVTPRQLPYAPALASLPHSSPDMWLLAFACFSISFPPLFPPCFLPTFFSAALSACWDWVFVQSICMLHVMFNYVALMVLLYCGQGFMAQPFICKLWPKLATGCCRCRRDRFMGAKDKPQIAT